MVQDDGPVGLDGVQVAFDDERVVSDAGLMLAATLAARLGIEQLAQRFVRLRPRLPGAGNAGRKVMSLIYAMALGADSIDDCDVLRAGRTRRLLGGWVAAPSTLGTFLRAFTFGHVRQLDRLLAEALTRAWQAGRGPGRGAPDGRRRQLHRRGPRPRQAGRGVRLHAQARLPPDRRLQGGDRRGPAHPAAQGLGEHLARDAALLRRADRARRSAPARAGPSYLRADSGFWSAKVFARLAQAGWQYSIGVRLQPHVRAAIEQISRGRLADARRLPADQHRADRRNRARRPAPDRAPRQHAQRPGRAAAQSWEYFPFATNRTEDIAAVEAEHRQHAVVELVIRDLKDQALAHFPSGHFHANAAWTVIACLAHNLLRWTELLGLPGGMIRAARSVRRRLLALPGRLTTHAGRWTLHLPARWPWKTDFTEALTRLRALPAVA